MVVTAAAAGRLLVGGAEDLARPRAARLRAGPARWRRCSASTSTARSRSPSSWARRSPPSPALLFMIYYGVVNFTDGFVPGVKAFTAAVLGGIGSLPGAVLGGLLIGLDRDVVVGLFLASTTRTSRPSPSSRSCSSSCRPACSAGPTSRRCDHGAWKRRAPAQAAVTVPRRSRRRQGRSGRSPRWLSGWHADRGAAHRAEHRRTS